MVNDADLVRRCRQGERQAFDALVQRYYSMAWRIARRFAATTEDADDLTQETFVAAYEHLPQLMEPDRFGFWLATIVRNQGRMWCRRRVAQPALFPLEEEGAESSAAMASAALAAARELSRVAAIRNQIAGALEALTREQRRAVELHYLEGHSYREMALLLGVPVGAVRGRLDRARGALRRELHAMEPGIAEWEMGRLELDALCEAAMCASADPQKGLLNSVFLSGGALASTDTHRVFVHAAPALEQIPPLLIHADLGRALRNLHPQARQGWLRVEGETAILRLESGDEMRAPLITGRFPDYRRVVPENFAYQASAAAADWLAALETLAIQRGRSTAAGQDAPADPRILITLSPEDECIFLRDGEARGAGRRIGWEVSASFAARFAAGSHEMILAANPTYVQQAVCALRLPEEDLVEFAAVGPLNPFVLRPAVETGTFVVTMPMSRETPVAAAAAA